MTEKDGWNTLANNIGANAKVYDLNGKRVEDWQNTSGILYHQWQEGCGKVVRGRKSLCDVTVSD